MADPVVTTTYQTLRVKYTHWGEWKLYASFAVSFGYRAVPTDNKNCRITRLWINDTLIYDLFNNLGSVSWVFYPGTEDQPFYRGQMVVFFGNFTLPDDSGAIPSVTAEIVDSTADGSQTGTIHVGHPIADLDTGICRGDFDGQRVYQVINDGSGKTLLRVIYTGTNTEVLSNYLPQAIDVSVPVAFAPWAQLLLAQQDSDKHLISFAKNTNSINDVFGGGSFITDAVYDNFPPFVAAIAQNAGQSMSTNTTFFATFSDEDDDGNWPWQILYVVNNKLTYGAGVGNTFPDKPAAICRGIREGAVGPQFGSPVWGSPAAGVIGDVLVAFDHGVTRLRVGAAGSGAKPLGSGPPNPNSLPTVAVDSLYTLDPGDGKIVRLYSYNLPGAVVESNTPIILVIEDDAVNHRGIVRKIGYDGTVIWTTATIDLDGITGLDARTINASSDLSANKLVIVSYHNPLDYTLINLGDGSHETGTYDDAGITIDTGKPYVYSSPKDTLYRPDEDQFYLQVGIPGATAIPLADMITSWAQVAGYDPDDIIVNGLDGATAQGYVIGANATLEDVLNNLMTIYQFTYAEVGNKLVVQSVFDTDGFLSQVDIPETDIALLTESAKSDQQIVNTAIADDGKLPKQINVRYIDPDLDYQQNVQSAKRTTTPAPTVQSDQTITVDIPIVSTGADMLARVYRALYATWASQRAHTIRLPQKYLALIPTDGFTFTAIGLDHKATAVSVTFNADFSLNVSAVERLPALRVPDIALEPPVRPVAAGPASPIQSLLLDLPDTTAAMESDLVLNLGVALSGYAFGRFIAGRLDTANVADPAGWGTRLNTAHETPLGTVVALSGSRAHLGPFELDNATQITIALGAMNSGDFASATYVDVLAGANRMVVGRDARYEILQYMDVLDNENGTVTISNLFRGRYGTEPLIGMLSINDKIMRYDDLLFITYPNDDFLARVGYSFRGVAPGEDPTTTDEGFLLPQAIAKRPWAPHRLRASYKADDSTIDLWWKRRERFNGELHDFDADIPASIGHTFSVDLWHADLSGIFKRYPPTSTFAVDGYDHLFITQADVEGAGYDFPPDDLNYYVYQNDPVLGRGWGANGTAVRVTDFDPDEGAGGGIIEGSDSAISGLLGHVIGDGAVEVTPVSTDLDISGALGHVTGDGEIGYTSPENDLAISGSLGNVAGDAEVDTTLAENDAAISGTLGHVTGAGVVTDLGFGRVTGAYAEVLRHPVAVARVTGAFVEVIRSGTPFARVSNAVAEVLWKPTSGINMDAGVDFTTGTPGSGIVDKPASLVSGDIMLAAVAVLTGSTITPPSGWTQIATNNDGASNIKGVVYQKTAGGSEPSTYTWTTSAGTILAAIAVVPRCAPGDYGTTDTATSTGGNTNVTTHTTPGITEPFKPLGAGFAFVFAGNAVDYGATDSQGHSLAFNLHTATPGSGVAGTDLSMAMTTYYNYGGTVPAATFTASVSSHRVGISVSFKSSFDFG